jgi:hypothetical protein
MTLEDYQQTRRHFDVIAEGLHSEIRQVTEGGAMTSETLERFRGAFEEFRGKTDRNFDQLRAETARNFAGVRAEAKAFRAETATEFKAVRGEAQAFRAETARNFADVQSQIGQTYGDLDRRLRAVENP